MDGPHVDAFAAALQALMDELRAWWSPEASWARADAKGAWLMAHAGRLAGVRQPERFVPVACYAGLDRPPPDWLLGGCRVADDEEYVDRADPNYWKRVDTLENFVSSEFMICGPEWLARARQAKHVADRGEPPHTWSSPEIVQRATLDPEGDGALMALLKLATSATPSTKWLRTARALTTGPGRARVQAAVERWCDLVPFAGPIPDTATYKRARRVDALSAVADEGVARHGDARRAAIAEICGEKRMGVYSDDSSSLDPRAEHPAILSTDNDAVLRGCVWLLPLMSGPDTVARLQRVALACIVQAPAAYQGLRYRSLKGLNACIWALGQIATPEAVTALGRIKLRARDERIGRQLAKAMADAAERAGMTIEDLEEIAVPTFDLEEQGRRLVALAGGHTATIAVESSIEVSLTIRRGDGSPCKTVPAAVKSDADSAAMLKNLKAVAAELERALPVQRLRLERGWLTGRRWTGAQFRERMLDHPLMAWFAERLIWTVTPAEGGARTAMVRPDGAAVDAEGRSLSPIRDGDTVALWHPLDEVGAGAVTAWRHALVRDGVTQPIKQAHREVYPLTGAERETDTYSNRFAGHIIRQAQSNALARLRGWSARSRMWQDVANDEPTHLKVPAHGMAAEFWTEGAGGNEPEVTEATAFVFLKTDRVRFRRLIDGGDWRRDGGTALSLGAEAVRMADVPAVVLSEVMRDVDLLVGVASIGHDPTWVDAGAAALHPSQWRRGEALDYWTTFNTAALSESALMRRDTLAGILPKLAIAPALTLGERHLVVRGSLRTYRIHLGSGNVFMEPNDSYLCIVPERRALPAPRIALPFEGDPLLSIILSKAFMLANDERISDPAILVQIDRAG